MSYFSVIVLNVFCGNHVQCYWHISSEMLNGIICVGTIECTFLSEPNIFQWGYANVSQVILKMFYFSFFFKIIMTG